MDVSEEGRYIPYSGGSMGWFENRGVLKCELANNYLFHQVMGSEYVRSVLFQRWGQVTDRRAARRLARDNSVNLLMSGEAPEDTPYIVQWPEGRLSGVTHDISHYGIRLQLSEPVEFTKGTRVTVQLLDAEGNGMLEVASRVIWIKREVVVRPVWFVGIAFTEITHGTEMLLDDFLGR